MGTHSVIAVLLLAGVLAGCGGPLSYREKGMLAGATLGGGAGYLVGMRTGMRGPSAAIGAGIGALSGLLVGGALDEVQAGRPTGGPVPPVPLFPVRVPGHFVGDPTAGVFINETPWRVRVQVDAQPGLAEGAFLLLEPGQRQAVALDIGPHWVVAEAWVATQLGPRRAGRIEETLHIDPRRVGWRFRLQPQAFR